jgi:autotransporter-associated beta strand protein
VSGRRTAAALGHCLAAGWTCPLAVASQAATFTVTTTANAGAGSLRQAILDANAVVDTDTENTIAFTLPENSTITLTQDLPAPDEDVILDAQAAPGLTLAGGGFSVVALDGVGANLIDVGTGAGTLMSVGNGEFLRFTTDDDVTIASDISDTPLAVAPGTLVKSGDAILTLSGTNVGFTGDLTLQSGTVIGDTDSLPGAAAGTGNIANSGVLVFDQTADGTYAGDISGSGSVEKRGAGNLTLTGTPTYAGGTTLSDGTLTGSAANFTGDIAIAGDADLVFAQPADGSFAGDISGAGAVTKQGAGQLTLGGANSYTGGTDVQDGALIGTTASIPGSVALASGTSLVFDQTANGTAGGAITGAGSLFKRGTGNVSLTGANSYAGVTTVEAGTLTANAGSLPGDAVILDPATLVFDQAGTGSFSGILSGAGDVDKRGAGTLSLDGDQTFTGATSVTAGTLELIGSLASPTLMVGAAGTLAGTGSTAATTSVLGAIAPGAGGGVGTLTLGDVGFAAGSRFVVDVDDSNAGDRLDAGATTIAAGATLVIDPAPGDYTVASTATVLDASALTGTFGPVGDFEFLTVTVDYGVATEVRVTLIGNGEDVTTIGDTPNQRAVGAALGSQLANPDLDELFENFQVLPAGQGPAALDSLSGEPISAFTTARLATAERFQRMLHRRMRDTLFESDSAWPPRSGADPPARRSRGPTDVAAPVLPEDPRLGVWLEGHGSLGDLDGDDNAAGVDYDGLGGSLGFDARIGDHLLAGLAGGYERTDIDLDRDGDGDSDTWQGAVYAAFAASRIFAGASGRYGFSQSDSRRQIQVGTLAPEARGDFDSHDFGARAEVAVNALELGQLRLEPLAGFEWNHLSREDFDEDGAGSLGLAVDSEEIDSSVLQLGARVRTLFAIGEDAVFAPELRAYWLHELGDRERRVEAALAGTPFVVEGAEAPADSGLFGAGWSVALYRNVRATADYDLRLDADRMEHVGSVSLRGRF